MGDRSRQRRAPTRSDYGPPRVRGRTDYSHRQDTAAYSHRQDTAAPAIDQVSAPALFGTDGRLRGMPSAPATRKLLWRPARPFRAGVLIEERLADPVCDCASNCCLDRNAQPVVTPTHRPRDEHFTRTPVPGRISFRNPTHASHGCLLRPEIRAAPLHGELR
jgi:hypothetical protein